MNQSSAFHKILTFRLQMKCLLSTNEFAVFSFTQRLQLSRDVQNDLQPLHEEWAGIMRITRVKESNLGFLGEP